MSILKKIQQDSISAMKEGKKEELEILKVVATSLNNAQIQKGREEKLSKDEEIKIISTEVKKLKDSISQFETAGRDELAKREAIQLEIAIKYLPTQLDDKEIESIVKEVIDEVGATSKGDMGMVMGAAMTKVAGQADGNQVKEIVMKMLP